MKSLLQKAAAAAAVMLWSAVAGVQAQNMVCHIEGTTTDAQTDTVMLAEVTEDFRSSVAVERVAVKDGHFACTLTADAPRCYQVVAKNHFLNGGWYKCHFIVENAHVQLTLHDEDSEERPQVTSDGVEWGKAQAIKAQVDAKYNPLYAEMDRRYAEIDSMVSKRLEAAQTDAQRDSMLQTMDDLKQQTMAVSEQYRDYQQQAVLMEANLLRESPVMYGLFAIYDKLATHGAAADAYSTLYDDVYRTRFAGHPYHQVIRNLIMAESLQPGRKYADYDVRGPEGRTVRLSSLFTGRIIFVDLWASWCGPCRRHARAIIPVYEKYKDKGFQVIGIAREKSLKAMQTVVRQDGYPWLNLLELNDEHRVWEKNGVSFSGGGGYLLAADGTILAVYPEADELEEILKEKLGD